MLIDTHAHLADAAFDEDREQVMQRARETGVELVVVVGETLTDARRIMELAGVHPGIAPGAGLYPTVLDLEQAEETAQFIRENRDKLTAIGEVGLDYWKVQDEEGLAVQRDIFAMFIRLSLELDLPLNVHSRSAGRHAIEFLIQHGARRVQMHAFDGKFSSAKPALDAGYYFSAPPTILYSRQKQKLFRQLPVDRILLETDSPVMSPDRETRNEPKNVKLVLEELSRMRGIAGTEFERAIEQNTQELYRFGWNAGIHGATFT